MKISPFELTCIRRFLYLTPQEAAEITDKTAADWYQYETGARPIPKRVAQKLAELIKVRAGTGCALHESMLKRRDDLPPVLIWYDRKEDMIGEVSTAQWRAMQSACIEIHAECHVIANYRMIVFDHDHYTRWLADKGYKDSEQMRALWAANYIAPD